MIRRSWRVRCLLSILCGCLPVRAGFNPNAVAQDTPAIDSATRGIVIARVADYLKDRYVFPELGVQMGERIMSAHSRGDYDDLTDLKEFCRRVTDDLRAVSHDKHLFVFYSPEEAREVAARNNLLPADEAARIERMYFEQDRRGNFGFGRMDILDGNVGYLELKSFSGSEGACETAAAAMRFLSSSDAIIIDLRENGGGGGGVVPLLASYFFGPERVPLTGCYLRATDAVEQSWTMPYVPGKRMPDVDLYILTSRRTFSAAEDFCYSLKHLKRATVIGETTKGGAHPVDVLIVEGDILTQISIGNSVNPITGSNWEGTGVEPDIEVPAEQALRTAHRAALEGLLNKTADADRKRELAALIEQLQ